MVDLREGLPSRLSRINVSRHMNINESLVVKGATVGLYHLGWGGNGYPY